MVTSLFSTVAMMLVYMLLGLLLCKSKKAVVSHAKSMSGLLLFVLTPAMIINSFLNIEYTKENLIRMGEYFVITLAVQMLFLGMIYIVIRKKCEDSKYRIMTIGGVLGNVGFMGMPIISSIFPDESIVLCYSSINVMSMNLIVFTIGAFMITNDKKYMSIKNAIFNPTSLAMIVAVPLFVLKIHFPVKVEESIGLLAKMVTPMCMFILGMRLSVAKVKKIFSRAFVYVASTLKLVIFPIVALVIMRCFPFVDDVLKTTVVVLAMTPSGAIIESLAEMYECEQEFAANVVFLTTILSVVTIPIMAYLLV